MRTVWPFLVIGLFSGSVYALAAMGVTLTYRTTGVFNFAYGAVAMFCAFSYWQLHDSWHLTAWIAVPLLMTVAAVVGLLFESLFRAFAGASAEIPMVATVAMLLVFQVAAVLAWGGTDGQLQDLFPVSTFVVGSSLHVGWNQFGTLGISVFIAIALWVLLRCTSFGTTTRAVVDNADLAEMVGVDTRAVRRGAWVLSSVFASLVGILLSPTQGLDVNQLILVVIYAFAPAVIGFVYGTGWAYGAALLLGVFQSILSKWGSSGTVADIEASIPYVALFVVLITIGGRLKEPATAPRATPASARVAGPAGMPAVRAAPHRRHRGLVVGIAGLGVALALPAVVHGPRLGDATIGAIVAIIALTLVVLTGWTGQVSLAQFSFAGVGAFAVGHLAGTHGQNFLVAALAGMAMAVPLGVVVGLPSLRLRGLHLMLATFAFALVMDTLVFNRPDVSGGLTGMTDPRPHILGVSFEGRVAMYELSTAVFGVLAVIAYSIRSSPVGRRLQIVRDAPIAASTLGVDVTVTKLVVFAISGAIAALGGALYGAQVQAIVPFDFQWSASLELLLLVVFGGRSMISGALIAGTIVGIQHLPIPASVVDYISLGVAAGALGLARSHEGTVTLVASEYRRVSEVLRPRPRRSLMEALR